MLKLLYVLCLTCIKTQRSDRIVNGRPANLGELPFQVSLRRAYNDFHFCGGTIITPKHVLTAAHCCFYTWGGQLPPEIVSVFAGSSVFRNATQIIVHVDRARNDIALIALHDNFPVSKTISPITLNTQLVPANTSCFVSGWGATHFVRKHVTDLLVAEVFTVAESLCAEEYDVIGVKIHQGEICAANDFTSSDACQGDSGGPLVCEGRLVGVVSTGYKCAKRGFPGIYTDVSFYLSWIDETLRQTW